MSERPLDLKDDALAIADAIYDAMPRKLHDLSVFRCERDIDSADEHSRPSRYDPEDLAGDVLEFMYEQFDPMFSILLDRLQAEARRSLREHREAALRAPSPSLYPYGIYPYGK